MKIIRTAEAMQKYSLALRQKKNILALVPTMGALHNGHRKLIRAAHRTADIVIVSIYVNPTQFGPQEDFKKYPRPKSSDIATCRAEGVHILFHPTNLYANDASTWVEETFFSKDRCGATRPGHFRGVTTVVAKLFNICQPHTAIFGQKDYQQCQVLQRMARDLNIPVRIRTIPTVRERDGLAMSSRNVYLTTQERAKAALFPRILQKSAENNISDKATSTLLQKAGFAVEYVTTSENRLCAAIRLGTTRLIDNFPRKNSTSKMRRK